MTEPKLDELRLKTDKQLILLMGKELDLGIHHAHQALQSADNWAFAERHYFTARSAYARAARVVRLVGEMPGDERSGMESRLDHLGEMLDALSTIESSRDLTEHEIAILARAFWKERGCPEGLPEEDWFRAERALMSRSTYVGS